ncbi:MAG: glycine cleavage system protein R [Gammaproteobacteria bacterium]|nr:glycine cleavage system protein R [Gammaproteobacteria bacterium]
MLQNLAITALGKYSPRLLENFSKSLNDCGCSITASRMTVLGNEFSCMMMLSGSWDSIAKLDNILPKIGDELDLAIQFRRTEQYLSAVDLMPYAIDVVCVAHLGIIHNIAKFFADNNILVHDMYTSNYRATTTGAQMFSLHMSINIPTSNSIASIRGEFMEFCDRLNMDAIMEPVK